MKSRKGFFQFWMLHQGLWFKSFSPAIIATLDRAKFIFLATVIFMPTHAVKSVDVTFAENPFPFGSSWWRNISTRRNLGQVSRDISHGDSSNKTTFTRHSSWFEDSCIYKDDQWIFLPYNQLIRQMESTGQDFPLVKIPQVVLKIYTVKS